MFNRFLSFIFVWFLFSSLTLGQVPWVVDQMNGELLIPNFKGKVKSEMVDLIHNFYQGKYNYVSDRQIGYCTPAILDLGNYFHRDGTPQTDSVIVDRLYQDLIWIITGEALSKGVVFGGNKYSIDFAYYMDYGDNLYLKMWITFNVKENIGTDLTIDLITRAGNFDKCMDYRVNIKYLDPFGRTLYPDQELRMEFVDTDQGQDGFFDFLSVSVPIPSVSGEYIRMDTFPVLDDWGDHQLDSNGNALYRHQTDTIIYNKIIVKIEIKTSCKGFLICQYKEAFNIEPNQVIRILRSLHKDYDYEQN